MVNISEYELNHIIPLDGSNAEIAIGQTSSSNDIEIELFNRSLALTSDLKRLPILRAGHVNPSISPSYDTLMQAGAIDTCRYVVSLHNADSDHADASNRIATGTGIINQSAGVGVFVEATPFQLDYEGGILLNSTITLRIFVDCSGTVAGASLPLGLFSAVGEIEVDWAEVSKKKFEEFLLESVYASDA